MFNNGVNLVFEVNEGTVMLMSMVYMVVLSLKVLNDYVNNLEVK